MTEAVKHDTVLDTGAEQLGKMYARALIAAAKNQGDGVAEMIVSQLNMIVDDYIRQSPPLAAARSFSADQGTRKGSIAGSYLWRRSASDLVKVFEGDGVAGSLGLRPRSS